MCCDLDRKEKYFMRFSIKYCVAHKVIWRNKVCDNGPVSIGLYVQDAI